MTYDFINNESEVEDESDNVIIYPHSVIVSDPVRAKDIYSENFGNSLFVIMIVIYSEKEHSDYIVNSHIVDIKGFSETSNITKKFKNLEDKDFKHFISSLKIIFEDFNKKILNFEDKPLEMKEFFSLIDTWMDTF